MSIPQQRYALPSQATVQQRTEIVDLKGLADIQCDLGYAPQFTPAASTGRYIVTASFVIATASTAFAWAFGHWIVPVVLALIPLSYAIPIVIALAAIVAVDTTQAIENNLIRILRNAWLAVWATTGAMAIPFLLQSEIAVLWLLLVALPVVLHFAYRFTTFGVYWITAHPLGDGLAMLRCRDIWRHRHRGVPDCIPEDVREDQRDAAHWTRMLAAVTSHDFGILWCYVAVLAGLTIAWLLCPNENASTIGLQSTVAVLLALAVVAWIRCEGRLPTRLLARTLFHWLHYNADRQATPWMLQSPCGDARTRSRWAVACLGFMAVAVNNLAGGYGYIAVPASQTIAVIDPEWMQPILMVLIVAIFCFAIPFTAVSLLLCIVAGPALTAFHRLYSTD